VLGHVFAVGYQDNGVFHMAVFDKFGKDIANINVNETLGIDERSKPITGFYEPLITIAFKPNCNEFLVSVYHRYERVLYSFVFDYSDNSISR
jgi:hypothetical protein